MVKSDFGQIGERGIFLKYTDTMAEFNALWFEQNEIYRKAAKDFGISESVLWILYSILDAGGMMRQSEISAVIIQPRQTTNSALKKMEKDGLITMCESTSRRCKDVSLTKRGREIAERSARKVISAEHEAMNELTPEEQAQMLSLLRKYNSKLSERLGETK